MTSYYNEIEPYAAQWLRNLIAKGLISDGEVDTRSIVDVRPDDLKDFDQCHFFAWIGGWSLAARLAGWPDDRPLWTGSCPCQPFSAAGKQKGQDDERHLWPEFFRLINACRPDVVMGEQVAAAVGKNWLDGVCADLEGVGYAVGAVVVPACAVGALHRRDRIWFVADAGSHRSQEPVYGSKGAQSEWRISADRSQNDVADAGRSGREMEVFDSRSSAATGGVGQTDRFRVRGSSWGNAEWAIGADGKARRVEPSIRLLAHGVSARVGRLRAYGNAIVPQVAAEVIGAFMEARP